MRTPIFYFSLGVLFSYFAFISIEKTVWNLTTILLLLLAALEFTLGIRYLRLYFIGKRDDTHKRD